jgi:cytolysin (calcineurin-like family phosphatase)
MMRRSRVRILTAAAVIVSAAALAVLLPKPPAYEITLFLASDTHYGISPAVAAANAKTVDAMNRLPGTAYPRELGGRVAVPLGVVVLGDLLNDAAAPDAPVYWRQFVSDFGLNGDGRLHFPVYELPGNHDGGDDRCVRQGIRERNLRRPGLASVSENGINYSWDWGLIHFVSLGLFGGSNGAGAVNPSEGRSEGPPRLPGGGLEFLAEDLARNVGRSGRPVVLLQHYGFDLWGTSAWPERDRRALAVAIHGYNVIAFFWGHSHVVMRVDFEGIPTFCAGATQADPHPGSFLVVRIRRTEMGVAERKTGGWGYTARVRIVGIVGVGPNEVADSR